MYVFVGEHIALVDFIKCLQKRSLLESGDYIVISVDDEIYDPNRRIKIIRRGKQTALWSKIRVIRTKTAVVGCGSDLKLLLMFVQDCF